MSHSPPCLFASKANIIFTHISIPQDSPDIVELRSPSGETLVFYTAVCGVTCTVIHDETLDNL